MELTLHGPLATPNCVDQSLEEMARHALASHPHFRSRVDNFAFSHQGESLIVQGQVPTFYLKQLVQSVLAKADCVRRIDNQIMVISCTGVSGR